MSFPAPTAPRRDLYPEIEPFASGWMSTEGEHEIYYEECGSPSGIPVVVLHGGPGGAVNPGMRRYFDPAKYRIILFDQRGCGKSRPHASLEDNTTWTLIEDIERLRERCGVDRWVVFGGSWGSTLSLAYAITHPERVSALVLRGIFLLTKKELLWFYQDGASMLAPDAWERFVAPIPEAERGDLMGAYYKRLTGDDEKAKIECAIAWSSWEGETVSVEGPTARPDKFAEPGFAVAFARIECWYFVNGGFFPEEDWIIKNIGRIRHIPGWIAQGRFDMVTPMSGAWALHRAWPEARLEVIPDAGHASSEPGIVDSLIRATDWAAGV
ncbi:proline iminopeptidase [Brevundimonas sp. Leaf363]|uniref:prolyl aminopeptidase n=1 Tax=Brevundimonas sp. Leaf363 TaxID=1736353 RepID=UPI0006FEF0E8|nr:prolyl aminopeptidase [Brevundimonas sp. Leaf363]KQS54312.1 proline iminopeptidase [Brevundimonas sp. Leaf363]